MKLEQISNEALAELLLYLAENEEFQSVKRLKGFSVADVKGVMMALAEQIKKIKPEPEGPHRPQYDKLQLSPKALALLSSLSPREEMLLFRSFKVV